MSSPRGAPFLTRADEGRRLKSPECWSSLSASLSLELGWCSEDSLLLSLSL
jgi:hypothetical protein